MESRRTAQAGEITRLLQLGSASQANLPSPSTAFFAVFPIDRNLVVANSLPHRPPGSCWLPHRLARGATACFRLSDVDFQRYI
jgi:hypothetical protein